MGTRFRTFSCGWCQTIVLICSHCDRGNAYCSLSCSKMARKKTLQSAGKKYQNTRKGKFKHTERQKRYKKCLTQKEMTHQSSQHQSFHDALLTEHIETFVIRDQLTCWFCRRNGIA